MFLSWKLAAVTSIASVAVITILWASTFISSFLIVYLILPTSVESRFRYLTEWFVVKENLIQMRVLWPNKFYMAFGLFYLSMHSRVSYGSIPCIWTRVAR